MHIHRQHPGLHVLDDVLVEPRHVAEFLVSLVGEFFRRAHPIAQYDGQQGRGEEGGAQQAGLGEAGGDGVVETHIKLFAEDGEGGQRGEQQGRLSFQHQGAAGDGDRDEDAQAAFDDRRWRASTG